MKASVLQETFSKAVAVAARFTAVRAQLPVLGNLHLVAKGNKIIVSATNLEMSVAISVGAKIEEDGEVTIPARTISDTISNLKTGQINLSSDKEQLKIKSSGFESNLAGMNAADFPAVPKKTGSVSAVLSKELFIGALGQTLFAVSNDETRPILTGLLFLFDKSSLNLVATDGFRLSEKKISLSKTLTGEKFILPKSPLAEIMKLTQEIDEIQISVNKDDKQVVFGLGGVVISSRVIEGDFPDYKKIIPKSSPIKITVDREDLLQAVRLAGVFARDAANVLRLKVGKDEIFLSAESSSVGSQKGSVEAKVEIEGDSGLEVAYNCRFLEDFLQSTKSEIIQIGLDNQSSPGVFADPKDGTFLHLIMPIKI